MLKLLKKHWSIISYLFWGVITTVVNIVVFAILSKNLHLYYQLSNVIAWFVSVLVAYISNKLWVFNSKTTGFKAIMAEAGRFFFMRTTTLILEMIILFIGISLMHGNEIIVKIIDNVIVVISNYAFSKLIVFREEKKWED